MVSLRAASAANPRWRRESGPPAFIVVWCLFASAILGMFVWAGWSITGDTYVALAVLKARPVRPPGDDANGPGVFHGKVAGPLRVAPSGESVVGWVGWVERAEKEGTSTQTCVVSQLEGVSLEREGGSLLLGFPKDRMTPPLSDGFSAPRGVSVVAPDSTTSGVPRALESNASCSTLRGPPTYHQITFAPGEEIVVSGCRKGDHIVPCDDRADFLFARCAGFGEACRVSGQEAVSSIRDRWRGGVSMVVSTVGTLVCVALTIVGVVQLRRHRALERRRRSVARAAAPVEV
ncbi:MAG: hypothetical protein U0414_35885 [Polyangiaceae bacterium]